jgi:hypothetical protein
MVELEEIEKMYEDIKNPKKSFKTGIAVQEFRKDWWVSEKAAEIERSKTVYPHISLKKLPGGKCPIGNGFSSCITCDFTDKIGVCCYPVDIQEEITAGRARPYKP